MNLLNDKENLNENEQYHCKNSVGIFNTAEDPVLSSSTKTNSVTEFFTQLPEMSSNSKLGNNANEYDADIVNVVQNNLSVRLRNHLGLKLLINPESIKTVKSTVEGIDSNLPLMLSQRPDDSSPCSPVSGSCSTTSADDSGFSSDENRSSEKQFKLARTKSLRSALRSPAHVGKRKSVRFADSLGLDLEQKTYFDTDDYRDNELCNFASPFTFSESKSNLHRTTVTLEPVNIQHRSEAEISALTQSQYVCLSSINISDTNLSGSVYVLNVACDKQICVRYTIDGWSSFSETRAIFTRSVGSDGAIDAFSFFLALPYDIPIGATCEFCIRYTVNNNSYWDNNGGQNYKLQCVEDIKQSLAERNTQKPWMAKNNYYMRSFLDYDEDDEDDDDDDYYYTPSYNVHSSKKSYFEQRYGCSYGDHFY